MPFASILILLNFKEKPFRIWKLTLSDISAKNFLKVKLEVMQMKL